MSSILLCGDLDVVQAFSAFLTIPEGDRFFMWTDQDSEDFPGDSAQGYPFGIITSLQELPGPPSIALILTTRDDGQLETSLAMVVEQLGEESIPIVVNTLFVSATELSSLVADSYPVIGISFVPGVSNPDVMLETAPALQVSEQQSSDALALLKGMIRGEVERVEDRVGLISLRILAMIINEATFALMEEVADANDIDVAMKLGTNYPSGPLEWADRIGPDVVLSILHGLYEEYGQERYRPSVLLKQYARARKSFRTEQVPTE